MACKKCEIYKWTDPQEPLRRGSHCLFHEKTKLISSEDFNEHVFELIRKVNQENKTRERPKLCVLSGTVFPGDIDFGRFGKDGDDECLPPIIINNATFKGKVNFSGALFTGGTEFKNTIFEDVAMFSWANFDKNTVVYFDFSYFKSKAFFYETKFHLAYFLGAEFDYGATFYKNTITYELRLDGIISDDNKIKLVALSPAALRRISFTKIETKSILFSHCEFTDDLILSPESMYVTVDELIKCEELYRSLKLKAAEEHNQPLVSIWHYREKFVSLERLKNKKGKCRICCISWYILSLYKVFSGFGERPARALLFLILFVLTPVLITFSTPFITLDFDSAAKIEEADVVTNWLRCIPFIRDIPGKAIDLGSWGRLGAAAMQILITLQAALFGFALRNKFRR